MKKHFVLVAGIMLCYCSQALAQVEPRVAGDWKISESNGQPAKVLHIGSDGRYQLTSAGAVVDSGRISASEGAVSLQSESGKHEQARFSMIGGELKMHGGSVDGSWSRSGAAGSASSYTQKNSSPSSSGSVSGSPASSFSPSSGSYVTPSSSSFSPSSSPSSSFPSSPPHTSGSSARSSSQAVPPSKAIWGSVSETHTSSPSPSASTYPSSGSTSSQSSGSVWSDVSTTPSSGANNSSESKPGSSVWSSISSNGSSTESASAASSPAQPGLSSSSSPQSSQLKSAGNKFINFVKNNLNAVNDAATNFSPGSTTSGGSFSNSGYAGSNSGYSGSNNARANAFVTPTAAQRYYGSGNMPRRSTSAGIPVMKDGTARKIRFGR